MFIFSLALRFVLVFFFSSFSIVITSLGEKRAGLYTFSAFYFCFARDGLCLFPLLLSVRDWLQLVIVAFPGLLFLAFSCFFFFFFFFFFFLSVHRTPSEKDSSLKGKNLLPKGANSFSFFFFFFFFFFCRHLLPFPTPFFYIPCFMKQILYF